MTPAYDDIQRRSCTLSEGKGRLAEWSNALASGASLFGGLSSNLRAVTAFAAMAGESGDLIADLAPVAPESESLSPAGIASSSLRGSPSRDWAAE